MCGLRGGGATVHSDHALTRQSRKTTNHAHLREIVIPNRKGGIFFAPTRTIRSFPFRIGRQVRRVGLTGTR